MKLGRILTNLERAFQRAFQTGIPNGQLVHFPNGKQNNAAHLDANILNFISASSRMFVEQHEHITHNRSAIKTLIEVGISAKNAFAAPFATSPLIYL